MKLFINFSEIIGLDILDAQGQWIGYLQDIAMNPQGDIFPKATQLIIKRGSFTSREYSSVSWEDIAYIEQDVRLKLDSSKIIFQKTPMRCDFSLKRDVLDQQIVDTDNHKVERVNDIHLLRLENQLYAAHVDVGLRALVRRLEWTFVVDRVVKLIKPKARYLIDEELVPWKNTQVLPKLGRLKSVVRLDSKNKLASIPSAALADMMQDLDIFARTSLFKSLEGSMQIKVFADMSLTAKHELMEYLEEPEVAQLVSNIPADEATDLLLTLPRDNSQQLMRLMETETSKKLRKLLGFASDSAGGLMTMEYLSLKRDATVADAWIKVKENANAPINAYFIYLVDENQKYLGTTSVRRFVNEDPTTPLIKTCHKENAYVYTDDGMEQVAILLERYKFSSIPVLNKEDILQGVITIDDVLEELISVAWTKYKEKL